MDEVKPWYLSKTVMAGAVTIIVSILSAVGVGGIEGEQESITQLALQIATVITGIVVIAGRLTASKKLTK